MKNFTPQYLKELREQQNSVLDETIVSMIQEKILKTNSTGKTWTEVKIPVDVSWKRILIHFEDLGFCVMSSGYIESIYDENGKECNGFLISWGNA